MNHNDYPPIANTPMKRFRSGFAAPIHGFQYLRQKPALWIYAIWPILINFFITTMILISLVLTAIWFYQSVYPWISTDDNGTNTKWELVMAIGLALLLLIICLALAVLIWKLLTGILCGYFYGLLATQVERDLGVDVDTLKGLSLGQEIAEGIKEFFSLVTIWTITIIVSIIPIIGPPLALIGGCYKTWELLGMSYFNYPLQLRGIVSDEKKQFVQSNRSHIQGLGSSVYLFQFIPIIGAVLLTTCAVGAVLLYHRIEASDARKSTPIEE